MGDPEMRASVDRRAFLKSAGVAAIAVGAAGFDPARLLGAAQDSGASAVPAADRTLGARELLRGLDGLSRAADHEYFAAGHQAAAALAAVWFCRENGLDAPTQAAILSMVEGRFFGHPMFEPRAPEKPDPKQVDALLKDLDAGIGSLRRAGHNAIFAVLALKAFRELPDAVTKARVDGIRRLVNAFDVPEQVRLRDDDLAQELPEDPATGFVDEQALLALAFEEHLKALRLWLDGKGHHGFAGHALTFSHALIELARMGHPEMARKGVRPFQQFMQLARNGAETRKPRRDDSTATPLERDYWTAKAKRPSGDAIIDSHTIKYPYSYYALLKDLSDDALKQRTLAQVRYLTAVS